MCQRALPLQLHAAWPRPSELLQLHPHCRNNHAQGFPAPCAAQLASDVTAAAARARVLSIHVPWTRARARDWIQIELLLNGLGARVRAARASMPVMSGSTSARIALSAPEQRTVHENCSSSSKSLRIRALLDDKTVHRRAKAHVLNYSISYRHKVRVLKGIQFSK